MFDIVRSAFLLALLFLTSAGLAEVQAYADPCDDPGLPSCTVTGQTVRPEDCGCNGFDTTDDTACWQAALCRARDAADTDFPYFGAVEADGRGRYLISDTLRLRGAFGGVINGNGAVLQWTGIGNVQEDCHGPDHRDRPMWLLENTQQLEIRDMVVLATYEHKLDTGFEFTNAPGGSSDINVAPIANMLNHVTVGGDGWDGIDYGVRFSKRHNIDTNNDQSTIMNSTFTHIKRAAISIEGTQSHQHRFYAVNATAAPGNETTCEMGSLGPVYGASFIRLDGGGFHSIGGFHSGFSNAEYFLLSIYTPVTIIDSHGEGNGRLLKNDPGNASFTHPVHIYGGRFTVNQLDPDGRIVDWRRHGPLTIEGMSFDGCLQDSESPFACVPFPNLPKIYFSPTPVGPPFMEGTLEVRGVDFRLVDPTVTVTPWDFIELGEFARASASGNLCAVNSADNGVPCVGVAGGFSAAGDITHAALSALSVPDGHLTFCTDCKPNKACENGGTGSLAVRIGGVWDCGGGVVLDDDASVTRDTEWDTAAEINAHTTDDDGATLTGAQTLVSKDVTSTSNDFSATGSVFFLSNPSPTSTVYCPPYGGLCSTTEASVSVASPALRPRTLYCQLATAPGAGKSWTFTARAGGADLVTCGPISGSATTCSATATSPTRWTEGAVVSLSSVPSGTPPGSRFTCHLGVSP